MVKEHRNTFLKMAASRKQQIWQAENKMEIESLLESWGLLEDFQERREGRTDMCALELVPEPVLDPAIETVIEAENAGEEE